VSPDVVTFKRLEVVFIDAAFVWSKFWKSPLDTETDRVEVILLNTAVESVVVYCVNCAIL
jgi:hypothetical protein